jgi:hypothetical protein
VGILHNHHGQLQPLAASQQELFARIMQMGKRSYSRFNQFQKNLAQGVPNDWRCRAGARYIYICENGLVHYCSQQRGWPGTPLSEYRRQDVKREFLTEKTCAPNCTISCVHQVSYIDHWRAPQTSQITPGMPPTEHVQDQELVHIQLS